MIALTKGLAKEFGPTGITVNAAFFTSTAVTMMPCIKVNGCVLGHGKMGPATQQLFRAWNDLVGLDIMAQARDVFTVTRRWDDVSCANRTVSVQERRGGI